MASDRQYQHVSVLLSESTAPLVESKGLLLVDCTLGGGGHTEALLRGKPEARIFAFDRDQDMIDKASIRFSEEIAQGRLQLIHSNYGAIRSRLADKGITKVDGILVDAGVSSFQIDQPERGFSFSKEGPLDMRMDRSQPLTAYQIVNEWPRQEIEKILYDYGEERFARKIVSRILDERSRAPIDNTLALARIVENCLPRARGPQKGSHPATRVFQALRIAVNDELADLRLLLNEIPAILNPGGVFSAISFHSLEDRLVKERLKYLASGCVCPPTIFSCARCGKAPGVLLQKKPILASEKELEANPRSRSAKLRVFVRNSEEILQPAVRVDGQQ
ncbi:MAG: 16S rRNA (cytosine(1402)-N(4))-methyltransferase RsmH [Bdellovibrionota bacterium]